MPMPTELILPPEPRSMARPITMPVENHVVSQKTTVYLSKVVYKNDELVSWFTKRIELPIPPFVGLQICLGCIEEYRSITNIWITPKGAIICDLPDAKWEVGNQSGNDCTEAEWLDVFAVEVDGWTETKKYEELEPS